MSQGRRKRVSIDTLLSPDPIQDLLEYSPRGFYDSEPIHFLVVRLSASSGQLFRNDWEHQRLVDCRFAWGSSSIEGRSIGSGLVTLTWILQDIEIAWRGTEVDHGEAKSMSLYRRERLMPRVLRTEISKDTTILDFQRCFTIYSLLRVEDVYQWCPGGRSESCMRC